LLSSSAATWQQLFGQDKQRWAFVGYLVHLFFNQQRFRADVFQIPQQRQALFVARQLSRQFAILNLKYNIMADINIGVETIFIQAKLDAIMESNAYIISKLDNTTFEEEYKKLNTKVVEYANTKFSSAEADTQS
jgi:hypothetical protein